MAEVQDVYEKSLTEATSVAPGDKVRVVMSDETSQNADLSVVAKAILETYSGTSLAGNTQSVKQAVDGLKTSVDSWNAANRTLVFGAKWDRTTNQLTRTNAAAEITTDTTNFGHFGSLNANYNNPFDDIYPWSEMQVVNVDLAKYQSGSYELRDCISAVYGDADFTYEGSASLFVGRYRPEFWYRSSEDSNGNVTFLISQCERTGYEHAEEAIDGISFCIDDGSGSKVTCGAGVPLTNVAVSTIHARAKASGFTLQDIKSMDAQIMLYLVEYANMNTQNTIGQGCASQYREGSDVINSVTTGDDTTTLEVLNTTEAFVACLKVGADIHIGASNGAATYKGILTEFALNASETGYILTLDRALASVTSGMYVSFHGFATCEFPYIGESLGNATGYLGVNGKANVFYRGALLYANRYSYVLGIYRQTGTNHLWTCPDGVDPNDYDALNTSVHEDTGIALPDLSAGAWQTVGANAQRIPGIAGFMATAESSGSSSSPVGDQQYVPVASAGDTILLFGGFANFGWSCGAFCGCWDLSAGASGWVSAGCPLLK